jgi:hypothetical protein
MGWLRMRVAAAFSGFHDLFLYGDFNNCDLGVEILEWIHGNFDN